MGKFKPGDRVRIGPMGHLFGGKTWGGVEECRTGDTATVDDYNYTGKQVYIYLDEERRAGVSYTVVDEDGLELLDSEAAEPQGGERYLDRAYEWLNDALDGREPVQINHMIEVARFLHHVDTLQQ